MIALAGLLRVDGDTAHPGPLEHMLDRLAPGVPVAHEPRYTGPLALGTIRARDRRDREVFGRWQTVLAALTGRLTNREHLPPDERDADPPPGDAERAASAYAQLGRACLDRLRGRFALAIWDPEARMLLLARDPMGQVPLYYHVSPTRVAFATSLAALAALSDVPRTLNDECVAAYLLRRDSHPSSTCLAAVRRLPPGHALTIEDGRIAVTRHYRPRLVTLPGRPTDADYADALRTRLKIAVQNGLPDDDSVGLHLSGGLDSSAIACLAAPRLHEDGRALVAVSSVLPDGHAGPETDERPHLATLEHSLPALIVHRVTATAGLPFADLEFAFDRLWTPVNPFHFMDRALIETLAGHGVGVALSGLGGDAGPSYRGGAPVSPRWRRGLIRLMRRLVPAPVLAWLRAESPPGVVHRRLARRYRNLARREPYADVRSHHLSQLERGIGTAGEEMIALHAALGLELVLPYRDLDLLEFLAGVPPEQFNLGGEPRSLFRRAMAGVMPDSIRLRPDKTPYVPDFVRRVQAEQSALAAWIHDRRRDRAFQDRIATENLAAAYQRAWGPPESGRVSGDLIGLVGVGTVAARFLVWYEAQEFFNGPGRAF